MLSQISWTFFLTAIAVVLLFYYAFIATVYYPHEMLSVLLGKKNRLPPGTPLTVSSGERAGMMGAIQTKNREESYLRKYQPETIPQAKNANTVNLNDHNKEDILDTDDSSYFLVAADSMGTPVIELGRRQEATPEVMLVGNVSDLMESIQTLLRVIDDGDGNTEDILNFFPSLLAQYPLVADSKYRYSINLFIHDHCKEMFAEEMSIETINDLWYFPYPPQAA